MQVDVSHAIQTMVEAMLPRGTEGQGLYVKLDVRGWNYEYMNRDGKLVPFEDNGEEEGPDEARASTYAHYLFYRPNNYTKVFFLANDNGWQIPSADADWLLASDHDSGWRSDGFRDLREVENTLREQTTPEGAKGFKLSAYICEVKLVPMTIEYNRDSGNHRKRMKVASLGKA